MNFKSTSSIFIPFTFIQLEIKKLALTNMDKEAKKALDKPNQIQNRLFDFVKQL